MVPAKKIVSNNLQLQKSKHLNDAIEIGIQQLKKGQKVAVIDAYQRIKAKLSVLRSG